MQSDNKIFGNRAVVLKLFVIAYHLVFFYVGMYHLVFFHVGMYHLVSEEYNCSNVQYLKLL